MSRFTPAYAGNTGLLSGLSLQNSVHPRIRGEYPVLPTRVAFAGGSPPHTRGIRLLLLILNETRFTPAYAGNTATHISSLICVQVHPRIRGEYSKTSLICHVKLGSPPHTRGILSNVLSQKQGTRFTPAYAGNTIGIFLSHCPDRVHPRIRGEYC